MATLTLFHAFKELLGGAGSYEGWGSPEGSPTAHALAVVPLDYSISEEAPTLSVPLLEDQPGYNHEWEEEVAQTLTYYGGTGENPPGETFDWEDAEAGTFYVVANELVFQANGESIGPFKYVVLYDKSAAEGSTCLGYWALPASVTLNDGDTLTVSFAGTINDPDAEPPYGTVFELS